MIAARWTTDDDMIAAGDLMECRWCGRQIIRDRHAWHDNAGFYNCGRYRPHWPVEPIALPLGPTEEA